MKISELFLLIFGIMSLILSSCNASTPSITPTDTTFVTPTKLPTSTSTLTLTPTIEKLLKLTPSVTPSPLLQFRNEPGLIVTLGEKVDSPWYPGIPVFSPDGQIIVLASSRIRFWDVFTRQLVREIKNPYPESCYLSQAKFSPDGKYFAVSITGCWEVEKPTGHLLIWDASTGDLVQEWVQEYAKMPGPRGPDSDYSIPVYAFAFIPNTSSIVFANGNILETRDIVHGEKQDILKLGAKMYATQISLSSDGRLAYIMMSWEKDHDWPSLWTHQHKFQVWNIKTHAFLLEKKYPEGWVNLSLKLLGTRLVEVDFESAESKIINLETNDELNIPFRLGWRYYNSDRSLMIYARLFGFDDKEKAIELWKTDTWRNIYTFTPNFGKDWIYGMHEIAFSPDNKILAIEHQEQVSLWNIAPVVQP